MSIKASESEGGKTVYEGQGLPESEAAKFKPEPPAYEGKVPAAGVTAYVSEEMQARQESDPGQATIDVRPDPPDGYGITGSAKAASGALLVSWELRFNGHVVRQGQCGRTRSFVLAVQRHVQASMPTGQFEFRVYDDQGNEPYTAVFQL